MLLDKREKNNVPTLGYLSVLILWSLVSTVAIALSLVVTNPLAIGPAGVTVWFLVVFGALAGDLALALYGIKTFLKVQPTPANRLAASWRQGLLLSAWLSIMLALSSLGQLALRDAILLGLLLVIVELYLRFRRT